MSELPPALDRLTEYDEVEERVENGDLCRVDGAPCDWEQRSEMYGEDRDGNRGVRQYYKVCTKCGEER